MNMKGKKCPYKDIICQEGYCHECQIYLNRQKQGQRRSSLRGVQSDTTADKKRR